MPTPDSVCRQRLAGQRLLEPASGTSLDVVRALGAVQAQDYPGAKWAIAQRVRGLTDHDIERDFAEGRLLRTHVLRPTWHVIAPEDARWMLALTAPRVRALMAYHGRSHEITPALVARSRRVVAKALEGGRALTRAELAAALTRAGITGASGQRLAHIVMELELDALICSGPRRGAQVTYALLDERAPRGRALSRDEALLELARRYWRTRSPASAHDFSWWSGLTVADARRAIGIAGSELRPVTIEGRPCSTHVDAAVPARVRRTAHLLPNYDEYFIGFRDRSAIGRRLGSAALVTGGHALIGNVIVLDGQLAGTWRRVTAAGGRIVELQARTRLTTAERSRVEGEVRRLGTFLGERVAARWSRQGGASPRLRPRHPRLDR